jgi:LEA14-like dessication related protein
MKIKIWVVIGILIVAVAVIAGLFEFERLELGKPTVTGITQDLGEFTATKSEILTGVVMKNPNPVPIPLESIEADVFMNGIKIGEISSVGKTEIEASQESILRLSTKIDNHKIQDWWVSHIKNGERTNVSVRGNLIFDLGLTKHEYPLEFESSLKTDILSDSCLASEGSEGRSAASALLTVMDADSLFGAVTADETEIITTVILNNEGDIPILLAGYDYEIVMNEMKLGEGRVATNDILAPDSAVTISLITPLQNDKISDWWVSHLKNGERTELKLKIQPVVEVKGKRYEYTMIEEETEFTTSILSGLSEDLCLFS